MPAIELDSVSKRYGDVLAVDDLDLTVESGEVFGFLGPNGAGKSTTIDVLLGFLAPSAGSVRVLGHDVTTDSLAVRQRTGLLPEGYQPYPNLTGREHVVSAIRSKGANDDPDALLDRVGLAPDDARRRAKEYSTGMRRRLSLAVALVGEPDLLVLDEPSAGLDPDGVALLREIIRTEADRGATVFFSSHVLEEVEKVCDRVGILDEGSLVAVDAVDDLRAELGAGATLSATLDSVPADLDLGSVAGVQSVELDGRTVVAECAEPAAKMRVLRRLDAVATVEDIGIEEASLESLFEAYTNRASGADRSSGDGAEQPGRSEPAARTAPATAGGESR